MIRALILLVLQRFLRPLHLQLIRQRRRRRRKYLVGLRIPFSIAALMTKSDTMNNPTPTLLWRIANTSKSEIPSTQPHRLARNQRASLTTQTGPRWHHLMVTWNNASSSRRLTSRAVARGLFDLVAAHFAHSKGTSHRLSLLPLVVWL